jgi:hypothetical protein
VQTLWGASSELYFRVDEMLREFAKMAPAAGHFIDS